MQKKLWLTALMAAGATCFLLGLTACGGGSGSGKTSGNLRFDLDPLTDTYSVSKNESDGPLTGALEIPASFQGKPVTRIKWEGFSGCSGLKSVAIPDSVTRIDGAAFSGCNGLEGALELPDSVTSIGDRAFEDCSELTSVTIPKNLASVGMNAFVDCSGLKSVVWNAMDCAEAGSSVAPIFGGCTNLSSVTFGNSVKALPKAAFYDCSGLTGELKLPDGVTSIGEETFAKCSNLTGVAIPDSVTSIGQYAFYFCSGLESIPLPNSVASIGEMTFAGCSGLTGELRLPVGLTSIGPDAFYRCSGIESVVLPDGLTSIGDFAFLECGELKSVVIPNSVTSVGKWAFEDCNKMESITLPFVGAGDGADAEAGEDEPHSFGYIFGPNNNHSVPDSLRTVILTGGTSVGDGAFEDCDSLTSITLPDSVTSIGNRAFAYCYRLARINIPESVTSIGDGAFSECCMLTSITVPHGVISIGDGAFHGCHKLIEVWNHSSLPIAEGDSGNGEIASRAKHVYTGQEKGCQTVTEDGFIFYEDGGECYLLGYRGNESSLTFPALSPAKNYYTIYDYAFYGCDQITSLTFGSGVAAIGESSFKYCNGLTDVIWNAANCTETDSPIFENCDNLNSLTIGNNVRTIPEYAFAYCRGLTSVEIPDGVTTIMYSAFAYCSKLTEIEIPASVTTLGNRVFAGCFNLTSVVWNAVNCTDAGGSYSSLRDRTLFYGCENLSSVTFGKGVKTIPPHAFDGCSAITGALEIPDSVTSIGEEAFYGCSGLTSVALPEGVDSIEGRAFYGCSGLAGELKLPENLTSIGWEAFYGCSGLTSVVIPDSVTSIGWRAFYDCSGLTGELKLPENLTSIGWDAFYGCSGLTGELRIPAGTDSIGKAAFGNCGGLEHITVDERNSVYHSDGDCLIDTNSNILLLGCKNSAIPDGVTSIEESAFQGCSDLTSIEIPNSVTSIGQSAFENCNSLTTVYYGGTSAEWQQVEILGNNSCLTSATVEYLHDKLVQAVEASLSADSYAVRVEIQQSKLVLKERFDFVNKIVSTEIENLAGETLFKSLCAVTEGKVYMYSDASGVWLRAEGTGDPATYMQTANPLSAFKTEWETFSAAEKSAKKNTAGEYVIGGYALTFADGSIATLHDSKTDSTVTFTQFNGVTLSLPTLGQADEAIHEKFVDGLKNSASAATFHAEWTLNGATYVSDIETGKSAYTEIFMQNIAMTQMYRECAGETLTLWSRMIDPASVSLTWMAWQKQTLPESAVALRSDLYLQNAASIITAGGNDPELLFIFAKYDAATDTFAIKDFDASGELFDYTLKISDGYITEWEIGNKTWLQSLDSNADSLTIYYENYNEAEVTKPQDIA